MSQSFCCIFVSHCLHGSSGLFEIIALPFLSSMSFDAARSALMSTSDVFTCALDDKRVKLHDLRKLPSGTAIRSVCYSSKGGGVQEKLQLHSAESLSSKSSHEVRLIASTLGIKRGSGGRAARVHFKKEELIERILQQRSDEEQSADVEDTQSASSSSAASTALRSTFVKTSSS